MILALKRLSQSGTMVIMISFLLKKISKQHTVHTFHRDRNCSLYKTNTILQSKELHLLFAYSNNGDCVSKTHIITHDYLNNYLMNEILKAYVQALNHSTETKQLWCKITGGYFIRNRTCKI